MRRCCRPLREGHAQPILIEEFIEGDELTVGVIGNDPPRIVGVMRVVPQQPTERFVYSLEVKRDWQRQVRYECPARLPTGCLKAVERRRAEGIPGLGCRDVARVDFRLRDGIPYFLEVNPLPGLNPESGDLVILSQMSGWNYQQLIGGVFQAALDRQVVVAHPLTFTTSPTGRRTFYDNELSDSVLRAIRASSSSLMNRSCPGPSRR